MKVKPTSTGPVVEGPYFSKSPEKIPASCAWFSKWPKLVLKEDAVPPKRIGIIGKKSVIEKRLPGLNKKFTMDLPALSSDPKDTLQLFHLADGHKIVILQTDIEHPTLTKKRTAIVEIIKTLVKGAGAEISLILEEKSWLPALDAALSALYDYDCFKERDPKKDPQKPKIISVMVRKMNYKTLERELTKINTICHAEFFARDLVNRPPSEKIPEKTALVIENHFGLNSKHKRVRCHHVAETLNLVNAVGRASKNSPKVLLAVHNPESAKNKKPIVLVGKGVCFDSGGLQAKPGESMKEMKGDMAGAAVVFGIIKAAADLDLPVHLVAIAPFVENMISGDSFKPDDVIESYCGKTVEVGHTDAEGRLILADILSYVAKNYDPELVVDYATLTGACVVALGEEVAGVFTSDIGLGGENWDLIKLMVDAGQETSEPHWPLPLYGPYSKELKSGVANIKSCTGSRWAGAITAALFLKEFVGNHPWLHVDIAGPALFGLDKKGATGFGVKSGLRFLEKYIGKKTKKTR